MIAFIIFILSVLIVYGLGNVYIIIRGWQALPDITWIKTCYLILTITLVLSFIVSMIFESKIPLKLTGYLQLIGTNWLFAMLYFAMAIIFFDLLRVANHFFGIFPSIIIQKYALVKLLALGFTVISVVSLFIYGYYQFSNPKTVNLTIKIDKKVEGLNELRIVAASDWHLGHIIRKERLKTFVDKINALHPDIILLPGDVIDRDLRPVVAQNMSEELQQLKAQYGVYAIPGNHEYFGNLKNNLNYLSQSGIHILKDNAVKINNFYVIGRDDYGNKHRKPLDSLMIGIDKNLPIILMDHQPHKLIEAQNNGIDLQLSGHTHNGQVWPFNYIVKKVFEIGHGYYKKGNTNYYVSSGLGLWGSLIRIGTQSEIVCITLQFDK
jgi:predicted MPP superfamily phosphohydrolase